MAELPVQSKDQITMTFDGKFYRVQPARYTELKDCSEILQGAFAKNPCFFPMIADDVHIYAVPGGNYTVMLELDNLDINTHWQLLEDDKGAFMCPRWAPTDDSVELMLNWKAPKDMTLILGQCYKNNRVGKPFLLALDTKGWSTYILPMSNLYENAEVCLGDTPIPRSIKSKVGYLHAVHRVLCASNWNLDLSPSTSYYQTLFRFDKDQKQVMAVDWQKQCLRVSSPVYNNAIEMLINYRRAK